MLRILCRKVKVAWRAIKKVCVRGGGGLVQLGDYHSSERWVGGLVDRGTESVTEDLA